MSLSGDVGGVSIEIRESPGLPSQGKASVKELNSGDYQIDSFFDVFVELSVGGGPFQPQINQPMPMKLRRARKRVRHPTPATPPDPNPVDCDSIVSRYAGDSVHALFLGGIDFSNPIHKCFENVMSSTDPGTGDESETFDSTVEGTFDDGSGPQPVVLTGPVKTVVRGKGGATTGSWDTEIVSMSLSGDVGGVSIEIRESPKKKSKGRLTVVPKSTGDFAFDSFFDIWIELSVDGGPFQPQSSPGGRMQLEPVHGTAAVPSSGPAGLVVLMAALVLGGVAVWRRKASTRD
jgi:hypothetical protein